MISHSEFSKLSPDQVLAVARDDWHLKHPVIEALTEQALSGAMLLDDCVDLDELFDAELATKCKVHCEYFKKKIMLMRNQLVSTEKSIPESFQHERREMDDTRQPAASMSKTDIEPTNNNTDQMSTADRRAFITQQYLQKPSQANHSHQIALRIYAKHKTPEQVSEAFEKIRSKILREFHPLREIRWDASLVTCKDKLFVTYILTSPNKPFPVDDTIAFFQGESFQLLPAEGIMSHIADVNRHKTERNREKIEQKVTKRDDKVIDLVMDMEFRKTLSPLELGEFVTSGLYTNEKFTDKEKIAAMQATALRNRKLAGKTE